MPGTETPQPNETPRTTPVRAKQAPVKEPAAPPAAIEQPSLLSNILAVIGFVILIVIVLWGLIHFAGLASPWFSSLFNKTSRPLGQIEVSAPASATSGDPMTVSWTYSASAQGMWGFLYECKNGLTFAAPGQNGALTPIPCGAVFAAGAGNSITVIPQLSGNASVAEPITIVFIPSGQTGASAQGSATVTINPAAAQAPASKKPAQKSARRGPADLMVRIVSISENGAGVGTFVFDISNVGASASGPYAFEAFLPTQSGYTYYSPEQSSLAPGAHVVSTLTFTGATPGTAAVLADPANQVAEAVKTNNYASRQISAPYGGYNYAPQPYQYQPGYTY